MKRTMLIPVMAVIALAGACGSDTEGAVGSRSLEAAKAAPTTVEATTTSTAPPVTTPAPPATSAPAPAATSDHTLSAPPANDGGRLCRAVHGSNLNAEQGSLSDAAYAAMMIQTLTSVIRPAAPEVLRPDVDHLIGAFQPVASGQSNLEIAMSAEYDSLNRGVYPNYFFAWLEDPCGPKSLVPEGAVFTPVQDSL